MCVIDVLPHPARGFPHPSAPFTVGSPMPLIPRLSPSSHWLQSYRICSRAEDYPFTHGHIAVPPVPLMGRSGLQTTTSGADSSSAAALKATELSRIRLVIAWDYRMHPLNSRHMNHLLTGARLL